MQESRTDILIYRVKDSGLEVFLFEHHPDTDTANSAVSMSNTQLLTESHAHIALEPITDDFGHVRQGIAVEADWHDIPSLRALMHTDYLVAKQKAKAHLKAFLPEVPALDLEKGTYVAIKDAFKQVLPGQYTFLKELKDIVREKNQAKYV
jgi:hypothetical protein